MSIGAETPGGVPAVVMAGLRKCLATRQAVNLDSMLEQAGIGRDLAMNALERLVAMQEVEVLCPVTAGGGERRKPTFHPLEHYRLVRSTDRDHLWQIYVTDAPAEHCWPEVREDDAVSLQAERAADFAWLPPWHPYAYCSG